MVGGRSPQLQRGGDPRNAPKPSRNSPSKIENLNRKRTFLNPQPSLTRCSIACNFTGPPGLLRPRRACNGDRVCCENFVFGLSIWAPELLGAPPPNFRVPPNLLKSPKYCCAHPSVHMNGVAVPAAFSVRASPDYVWGSSRVLKIPQVQWAIGPDSAFHWLGLGLLPYPAIVLNCTHEHLGREIICSTESPEICPQGFRNVPLVDIPNTKQ